MYFLRLCPENNENICFIIKYEPGDAMGMIINNTPIAVSYIFNKSSSVYDNKNIIIHVLQQNVMIHEHNTNDIINMTIEQKLYEKLIYVPT